MFLRVSLHDAQHVQLSVFVFLVSARLLTCPDDSSLVAHLAAQKTCTPISQQNRMSTENCTHEEVRPASNTRLCAFHAQCPIKAANVGTSPDVYHQGDTRVLKQGV